MVKGLIVNDFKELLNRILLLIHIIIRSVRLKNIYYLKTFPNGKKEAFIQIPVFTYYPTF